MLEIQELTRRVARSGEAVERSFADSTERFFSWIPEAFQRTHPRRGLQGIVDRPNDKQRYRGMWAIRLTAIPLRPLSLGRLPRQPWLQEVKIEDFDGGGRQGRLHPYDIEVERPWAPRLRAVEREFRGDWLTAVDRLNADGQVERFARVTIELEGGCPKFLHLSVQQFMWHVASVIRMADIVRAQADRPTQDYAFEIEFMNSDVMHLDGYPGLVPPGLQNMQPSRVVYPRYEIGGQEYFNELLTTVDNDFWNASGNHPGWELAVNWPPATIAR